MLNYEINNNTLALFSIGNKTKVIENNHVFMLNKPILEVIEQSCEYFGSSLLGRQKGTQNMIGVSYKAPIIIEESKNIIFFPTCSPRLSTCNWISLNNIDTYYNNCGKIVIKFKNNKKIYLNLSFRVVENQILRATRLDAVLRGRK